jgi:small subunit ribosomal protein S2
MSALPQFSMRDLLEAGVHYGHKTMRWNPRMAPYLFGSRNGIHIIDLQQTVPLLHQALKIVYEVVKANGRVLFVGTKRQASEPIAEAAKRCGQYYVNHRWLGGMLTNWNTVSQSIKTLREIESKLVEENTGLTKKEVLGLQRQQEKLQRSLGGIMDMGGKPDLLFVIDTNKESLAMAEAKKLGIPVIAVVDSNSNPDGVDFTIPGNDDATRAIELYCRLISDSALLGIQEGLSAAGVDIGANARGPRKEQETFPSESEVKKLNTKKKTTVVAKKEAVKVVSQDDAKKAAKPAVKKTAEPVSEEAPKAKPAVVKKPAAKEVPAKKVAAKK